MRTARRIEALYLRTIQLVLVATVVNLSLASSIDNVLLVVGRRWRFALIVELAVLALAYRAWRADEKGG